MPCVAEQAAVFPYEAVARLVVHQLGFAFPPSLPISLPFSRPGLVPLSKTLAHMLFLWFFLLENLG